MTDLERTEQHFQSLGYSEMPAKDYHYSLGGREYSKELIKGETHLTFGDGRSRFGYNNFGFVLVFAHDGKFIAHGAFE